MSVEVIEVRESQDDMEADQEKSVIDPPAVETLEELYRLPPPEEADVDTDLVGGRALFSNILPRAAGSMVLEHAARESTRNVAAGTEVMVRRHDYFYQRAPFLGRAAVGRRRVQGSPARPGR